MYGKAHETANRILEAFQHPENLPKALAPILIQRNDGVPCRAWSWHNQFLVAISGTSDARGYKQWQGVGRHVVKGAKAVHILAPCLKKIPDEKSGEDVSVCVGFRCVPVFRAEDTDGAELPDESGKWAEWTRRLPLNEVAQAWEISITTYSGSEHGALGWFSQGRNTIALGVENTSTWAHEMIHAADHRLEDVASSRPVKEVIAELGGAVLLECLGMHTDADLGGAYEYIQGWSKTTKRSAVSACCKVLDRTCECVNLILRTAAERNETGTAIAV